MGWGKGSKTNAGGVRIVTTTRPVGRGSILLALLSPNQLSSAPRARKESRVNARTLREFLGTPRMHRWRSVLSEAGVVTQRGKKLSYQECERVMSAWYRQLGERRVRQWKG